MYIFCNLVFIVISTTILFVTHAIQYYHEDIKNDYIMKLFYLDLFGHFSHSFAWTCTFLSCFMFSKIAYDVAHKCRQKLLEVRNNARKTLDGSIEIDEEYILVMKASIVPFSFWFSIHWLSYCLTTFLSIAFVIQNIQHDIYKKESSCYKERSALCWLKLIYHITYAMGHGVLFVYPCFRAAALSTERAKFICDIAKERQLAVPKRQAFVQYLQVRDYSFKVKFLCTTVTFGGNLAYFSIFAGIMTAALRIAL